MMTFSSVQVVLVDAGSVMVAGLPLKSPPSAGAEFNMKQL